MIEQLIWLAVLASLVACVSWTFTREEIFREVREWLTERQRKGSNWWLQKFLYGLTCEYCFSHYVAAGVVALTDYRLLLSDWRGYVVAGFALVWLANAYLSAYSRLRVDIHKEKAETEETERRTRRAG